VARKSGSISGKRKAGGGKNRSTSRASKPLGPGRPDKRPAGVDRDALWDSLRQGARNVAGVRYQLAVTAYLLAESKSGALPFVELVPEGYEDIDCLDGDSRQWYVQVKEVGAGAGRFTASSVAEVISHAAAAAADDRSRIVAVTDGQLGGQVVETGWNKSIAAAPGYDVKSTVGALEKRGHSLQEALDLVARSHLVRLPWNATPLTNISIAGSYGVAPAVAAIIASKLLDDLAEVAAGQRHKASDRPGRRNVNDLDALVARVMTVVDVGGLDTAVRAGVCEVADYSTKPGFSQPEFLLGVDATPSHIGANFDILRPVPTRAIQVGLEEARYALVAGPSGAGKSAQMWRSARDAAPGARVLRVLRVETDTDVMELVRHVELLEPSEASAVLVCCDDLGRPRTGRWPIATRRLLEIPGVFLIGAVRQEDFTAELLRYGGELVELALDESTASAIADQLALAGVDLALEVGEAIQKADGQLMEYVALLTTGQRMRAVLSDQAESLLRAENPGDAAVARLICAGHVLGVSLDAPALAGAIDHTQSELTTALIRLANEHIITSDDRTRWRGLHQRRSDTLTELLHEIPPPTLAQTLDHVLRSVDPHGLGWCLRRMAELFSDLPAGDVRVVGEAVARCTTAAETAGLLEGLERADHSVTAAAYIPVLERYRRDQVPLLDLAMLVCGDKFAGIRFGTDGDSLLDRMGQHIHRCAEELPDRFTGYSDAAGPALRGGRLTELLLGAALADAVRLLEAAAMYTPLGADELKRIATTHTLDDGVLDGATRRLHGRLLAACHVASREQEAFTEAFGTLGDRLSQASQSDPDVVSAVLVDGDSPEAVLQLLARPTESEATPEFPWDLQERQGASRDDTNRNAVELATRIGEWCPELSVVEVRTILADGSRLRIGDFEPGHKRLARNARPPRELVRVNVGVQAAISRQAAAFSWTELIRTRTRAASLLASLIDEAPRRLSDSDNPRRRQDWQSELVEVGRLLGSMPRPPASSELDLGSAAARWDEEREDDVLTVALRSSAAMLQTLVPEPPGRLVPAGAGDKARECARQLREALADATNLTSASERVAYLDMAENFELLRNVLVALAYDPSVSSRIRGTPESLRATLLEVVEDAAARQLAEERHEVENEFAEVPGALVVQVADDDPFLTSIAGHQWVITVPPESWGAVAHQAALQQPLETNVPVSVVCELDQRVLPIAARRSTSVPAGILPLDGEAIGRLASMLGREVVAGPTLDLVAAVVGELTLASWAHARRVLRSTHWADPGGTPEEHLAKADAKIAASPPPERPVAEVLEELANRVREELSNEGGSAVLAAELAGPVFESDDIDDSHALATVSRAVLAALDVELDRAIGD
jgi:hypothetical protein